MKAINGVEMIPLEDYKIPTDEDVEDDEFEEEGWDGTVPLMLWAVQKGLLDKHLLAMGTVMRQRYAMLFPDANRTAAPAATTGPDSGMFTALEAVALDLLGRDKLLSSTSLSGSGTVEFDGARYEKKKMTGQYFRMPPGVLGERGIVKYVGGKVVQIISVGRNRLRVRLAEELAWASKPEFKESLKNGQWDVDFDKVSFIFGK